LVNKKIWIIGNRGKRSAVATPCERRKEELIQQSDLESLKWELKDLDLKNEQLTLSLNKKQTEV
jgi:hypothetical protein